MEKILSLFNIRINFLEGRQFLLLIVFCLLLIFSLFVGVSFGGIKANVFNLFSFDTVTLESQVLTEIRIPRVLLAGFVGASLGLAGASLQGLFRNPLADPGLIGVSAGAALGAALAIVIGSETMGESYFGFLLLPLAAIIGSSIVIFLLFSLTRGFGVRGVIYMILVGIAINAFATVGIGVLTFISTDSQLRGLTFWTMGSFGGANWNLLAPAMTLIIVSAISLLRLGRKLDLLQLGEDEANRLGVDVKSLKLKVVIFSAVTVGVSVSLSGIIGFVGLVIPHVVRLIGGVKHKFVLPGSVLLGASIMITADLISRTLILPAELPVGLITSAIGAPFFLWLIFRIRMQ